jgi:hypothetical protein
MPSDLGKLMHTASPGVTALPWARFNGEVARDRFGDEQLVLTVVHIAWPDCADCPRIDRQPPMRDACSRIRAPPG